MDRQAQEAACPAVWRPQKLSNAAADLTGGLDSLSCLISKKQE